MVLAARSKVCAVFRYSLPRCESWNVIVPSRGSRGATLGCTVRSILDDSHAFFPPVELAMVLRGGAIPWRLLPGWVVLISLSFGPVRKNGKAGPATGSGSDVDAVSQNSDRLAHDE